MALLWFKVWTLRLEATSEPPPCPLWSNQPMASVGKLLATVLLVPALLKLITVFCLSLLLLLINHSPVLGPGERGLREKCQPWLSRAAPGLGPRTSQAQLWRGLAAASKTYKGAKKHPSYLSYQPLRTNWCSLGPGAEGMRDLRKVLLAHLSPCLMFHHWSRVLRVLSGLLVEQRSERMKEFRTRSQTPGPSASTISLLWDLNHLS